MNQSRFKICRVDETSILPVSKHNLHFNSSSKMFSPANRWSRRQKHARDARFGTQKKYGVDAQLEDGASYPLFARAAIFFSI
jgi:hypothetical protein